MSQFLQDKILLNLLEGMLDNAAAATIECVCSERTLVFSVDTTDGDRGKLIGMRGRNVDAIRTLCTAMAARYGYKFHLNVVGAGRRE